jgi:hypothetical protein
MKVGQLTLSGLPERHSSHSNILRFLQYALQWARKFA